MIVVTYRNVPVDLYELLKKLGEIKEITDDFEDCLKFNLKLQNRQQFDSFVDDIFDELFALDDSINSVMIFGHNPTFTDFVNYFKRPEIYNLPTSGVVAISFKTDKWEEIPNSKSKIEFLVTPKML